MPFDIALASVPCDPSIFRYIIIIIIGVSVSNLSYLAVFALCFEINYLVRSH